MKKIHLLHYGYLLFAVLLSFSCSKTEPTPNPVPNPPTPTPAPAVFAKGADVGWLTQMEAAGKLFYNSAGSQKECMQLLKDAGMNAIRLRVWVNPVDGWNNAADVLAKASRAKQLGMRLLIDFHYSDTWADPGHQTKPAAWSSLDFNGLKNAVYQHTFDVLQLLKSNQINPEWVQVGNETNDGMLWPEGKASTQMNQFAQLVNKGYDAVKAVNDSIKVIVHLSNGFDNGLFRWMFDGLTANQAKFDVIGLSLYPSPTDWVTKNNDCLANMNDLITRYQKPVMVTEVGMSWDQPTESKAFLTDLIQKTKNISNNKGLGVFYWEPEAYGNWQGYTLGAFDNSGKPTAAIEAFQ